MEKKKLLLVAISVGVFLVIVIGAAYLAFSPRDRFEGTVESRYVPVREPVYPGALPEGVMAAAGEGEPASMDAVDIIRNPNAPLPLVPGPGIQQENNFYINNSGAQDQPVLAERTAGDGSRVLINVPRPSAAAVPNTPPLGRAAPASAPAPAPAGLATEKKTPAPGPGSRPAASKTAAAPPKAQSPVRLYDTYWIQTGSFSAKTRAEGVKETLAARGVASIIENRAINGRTYFRVRVGPYATKNEADYWLSLVKSIEGFEDSQIWQNRSRM
jgi:DedD protein